MYSTTNNLSITLRAIGFGEVTSTTRFKFSFVVDPNTDIGASTAPPEQNIFARISHDPSRRPFMKYCLVKFQDKPHPEVECPQTTFAEALGSSQALIHSPIPGRRNCTRTNSTFGCTRWSLFTSHPPLTVSLASYLSDVQIFNGFGFMTDTSRTSEVAPLAM